MALLHIQDAGPNKIQVIKVLRELFNFSLMVAKECVEGTVQPDVGAATKALQVRINRALTEVGVVRYHLVMGKKRSAPSPEAAPAKTWHERLLDD